VAAPADSEAVRDYVSHVALYRQGFRHYLRNLDWAQEWRSASFSTAEDGLAHDARVLARLHEAGWNRYGWPRSAGGLGGDEIHRAVYYEELAYAMLPVPAQQWTLETLGPALLKFAPPLAAPYLPGYLRGSEWWGQASPNRSRAATWRRCAPARSTSAAAA
jgi:acyl-CoA dehydrogenase